MGEVLTVNRELPFPSPRSIPSKSPKFGQGVTSRWYQNLAPSLKTVKIESRFTPENMNLTEFNKQLSKEISVYLVIYKIIFGSYRIQNPVNEH